VRVITSVCVDVESLMCVEMRDVSYHCAYVYILDLCVCVCVRMCIY